MLSVAEALAKILSGFKPLEIEQIALEDAVGRVLAESVKATLDLPPFTNSSMDGFAVRAADVQGASSASPVTLTIAADIPAGVAPAVVIQAGTAARIMTGAHMPAGADAVVPVEATGLARTGMLGDLPATVPIHEAVQVGAYVRPMGEDVRQGQTVIPVGQVVRAYDLSLLASFGLTHLNVIRRPRVAILATGDELVGLGETPGPGQIRDSNSYTLAALVRKYGGEPIRLGVAPDRLDAVVEMLKAAVASGADLIVSSAGVSVGAYDVVKEAIELDGSLDFWRVRLRPGKPFAFGTYHGLPYFGLPGNPVSTIVTFELFVRPALLKLGGLARLERPMLEVELLDTIQSDGRESYLRATVTKANGHYQAQSSGGQGSNILSALVRANALLIVPADVTEARAGSHLNAWILDSTDDIL
jgi:molybdopterin molybdotransferase